MLFSIMLIYISFPIKQPFHNAETLKLRGSANLYRLLAVVYVFAGTNKTEHFALRLTSSLTLPSKNLLTVPNPLLPKTKVIFPFLSNFRYYIWRNAELNLLTTFNFLFRTAFRALERIFSPNSSAVLGDESYNLRS